MCMQLSKLQTSKIDNLTIFSDLYDSIDDQRYPQRYLGLYDLRSQQSAHDDSKHVSFGNL